MTILGTNFNHGEYFCDARHKPAAKSDEINPLEKEAARHDLNYVKLDGNIGLMVNGAGLPA